MAPVPDRARLVREISLFLIVMGVVLGGLGILAFTTISPQAAPIRGIARHVAFGVPLLVLGAVQLLCGMLFLATKKTVFGAIGAVAAALVSVLAFVLVGIGLISLLLAAAPIMIGQRLSQISKATDGEAVAKPEN